MLAEGLSRPLLAPAEPRAAAGTSFSSKRSGRADDHHPISVTLALSGLTCASCVHASSQALKALPGVLAASVALVPTPRAAVTYDPALCAPHVSSTRSRPWASRPS